MALSTNYEQLSSLLADRKEIVRTQEKLKELTDPTWAQKDKKALSEMLAKELDQNLAAIRELAKSVNS